ncbi:hypothetical protein [Streptomyces sp. NPDC059010]|uniref:hypothetical protein n=1 Tax=Streptomyces sp. NPDC059010 TaxID=3346695 RepID=UPI0036D08573
MTGHPGLALTAAAVTTLTLLARVWATPRKRRRPSTRGLRLRRHRSISAPVRPRQTSDPSALRVLREAEQQLSRQWNRLHAFYPHLADEGDPQR